MQRSIGLRMPSWLFSIVSRSLAPRSCALGVESPSEDQTRKSPLCKSPSLLSHGSWLARTVLKPQEDRRTWELAGPIESSSGPTPGKERRNGVSSQFSHREPCVPGEAPVDFLQGDMV
ncbi:uncharacterized protein BDZ83DRAFT_615422 [Colletotrichum acutatum]|uniref:Secreted protein n=1 Tax=Glomerella acutata TaxID=27357 RepID=A0AAD8USZ4_GLOAC|nr:uncharacterized protein BDZ83DRAFT_615422 [Colletotrichum acutatum]KAK1726761.1 hypothetical protein BDZ83DRAFT_615422 [Colletotrichum acutatum]